MNYEKKFSVPHYDRFSGKYKDVFYDMYKNASQEYINSIHDIYFGKYFYYRHNEVNKFWGNAMGVEATDEQINNLFKLQDELGIEISLTMNSIDCPYEIIYDEVVRNNFVNWIGNFYDRGLRSCTIASEHLMRQGILQDRCPDMRWKSTVNQICADAQQLIDLAYLGYNTILLDRSLNRNLPELKRIKKAQDYLNSKKPVKKLLTSLLVSESCIYRCPFKREHDSVGEHISTGYFNKIADLSCNGWRGNGNDFRDLPRSGINLVVSTAENFNTFSNLVDIFKHSGRLTNPIFSSDTLDNMKAVWFYTPNEEKFKQSTTSVQETVYCDNFDEIIANNLIPIHSWIPGWIDTSIVKNDWRMTYKKYEGLWSTDTGKKLEHVLTTCKSQCWDCHLCEDVYNQPRIDSALQLRKVY